MRFTNLFLLSLFGAALASASLRADDEVLSRSKGKIYGSIKTETALGVTLEGKKDMIPAGDIIDIRYDKRSKDDPSREFYNEARAKEAALEKSKSVREALRAAVLTYESTLSRIPAEPEQALYKRNVEFRIAYLRGRMAVEFGDAPATALGALKSFKDKNPNSWQIVQCLQKLAELQLAEKKFVEAEKTYTELVQAPVSQEIKQEAEFLAARLSLQTGNLNQAETRFEALIAKLPKDSPVVLKAQIAQIECLTLAKKTDEANKRLRQMLKESTDNNLKALAHNALGKNLFDEGKLKEARWEFLWVDVVFNQDKAEHAKSLYYLWQTFSKLNETDRAQECLEALLSDQFAGTEFQRKAKVESKK